MEDNRRKMEASLARKRIQPNLANAAGAVSEAPLSPTSSGAMDSLLEKLRAAAPQAKDQRDRRRRARLKERHQVRIASGQQMPDLPLKDDAPGGDSGGDHDMLSPTTSIPEAQAPIPEQPVSEGEDVADRAASMLQGLRGDGEGPATMDRDGSLRVRRRRESADDERKARRRRRAAAGSTSADAANATLPPLHEGRAGSEEEGGNASTPLEEDPAHIRKESLPTPTIIVSPTSTEPPILEGSREKPVEIDD